MKRVFLFLLIPIAILSLFVCSKTKVRRSAPVTLDFVYEEKNIHVTLTDEEAAKVIEILNGNTYDPILLGYPSCGFSKDVALKVGNRRFSIASDTCNCIFDASRFHYFDIPEEEMDYIHSLIEKYGGYFPCV